ncbi:putative acetyltransferase [Aquimarina sp. MAR_2010_214]|uniref:GNAT family N-acetyltransferase n=1 Tax=Aquimarina sp. MAR_2010_214 TaxID=1250026 RepID=UPI000C70C93C|nr:GNAT family N-acetyltransferase [Aquimarina sp. MAR_2010_214]PKV52570.1 putative acetyltransferase [Aquimarina sp. MAR_2010_214]
MIRKYKEVDLEILMKIWGEASVLAHPFLEDEFVQKVTQDMRQIYLPNPEANTYVYKENENIVGFISMIENEIAGLFVNPKNCSKGIGSALVNYVQEKGYDILEVEVFKNNEIGRAFYDKYGFKKINEYFFEAANQNVLRMRYVKKNIK